MPDNNGMTTFEEHELQASLARDLDWGVDADGIRRTPMENPKAELLKLAMYGAVGLFILVVAFLSALSTGEWTLETLKVAGMGVVVVGMGLFLVLVFGAAAVALVWEILKTVGQVVWLVWRFGGWVCRRHEWEDVAEPLDILIERMSGPALLLTIAVVMALPGTLVHIGFSLGIGTGGEPWAFFNWGLWLGCVVYLGGMLLLLAIPVTIVAKVIQGIVWMVRN